MKLFESANSVSILDVYGMYVRPLNKTFKNGKPIVVNCPFHADRRPSFNLYPNNTWHCFSCEAGHTNVDLVMKLKNIDCVSAAKMICEDFHVEYEKATSSKRAEDAEGEAAEMKYLAGANLVLAKFFHEHLKAAPDKDYFAKRGLGGLVDEYMLGYCPKKTIVKQDSKPGTLEKLVAYGLCNEKGESVFAGRYIVPIRNIAGAIIGFIGRLPDEEVDDFHPKYINSADSAIFRKRACFFNPQGLMEDSPEVIVVEGVFDALSYIAAGVKNVVSPMGCSLSDSHLKTLKSFSKKGFGKTIVLCFDKDAAGEAATERAVGYIRDMRVNVSSADFKGKKDANDVLLSLGPSYLAQTASSSQPAPEYLIGLYEATKRLETIQGKEALWRALAKFLGSYEKDYRDNYPINQAYTPITFNLYWRKYASAIDAERAGA